MSEHGHGNWNGRTDLESDGLDGADVPFILGLE